MSNPRQTQIRLRQIERRGEDMMRRIAERVLGVPFQDARQGHAQGQGQPPHTRTGSLRFEEIQPRVRVFFREGQYQFTGRLLPKGDRSTQDKFYWLDHYFPFVERIEEEFAREFERYLNQRNTLPPPEVPPAPEASGSVGGRMARRAAVGLALSLATAGLMAHPAMRAGLKSQLLDARLRLRGVQPYRGSPVAARIGQQSFEPMRQFRRRA